MKNIAIFCGSNEGGPVFVNEAIKLSKALIARNLNLIYGGAKVGLMGVFADSMLKAKQKVIGVMPKLLVDYEVAHDGLTKLHIVETMHERKALMEQLADAFIIFPGGIGTMDEFFEIFTWATLSIHNKPIGILNVNGYFDDLLKFMSKMIAENFLAKTKWDKILIADNAVTLLNGLELKEVENTL